MPGPRRGWGAGGGRSAPPLAGAGPSKAKHIPVPKTFPSASADTAGAQRPLAIWGPPPPREHPSI